jgi:hypothetical protein
MVSARLILSLLLLALAACSTAAPTAVREADSPWRAETRAILVDNAARSLARPCSRPPPGPIDGYWTPVDAQIAAIEPQLFELLEAQLRAIPWTHDLTPDDYHRQYAGLVIDGRQVIYVGGFLSRVLDGGPLNRRFPERTWRDEAVWLCDYGAGDFGVEYDVETSEFRRFSFGGTIAGPVIP